MRRGVGIFLGTAYNPRPNRILTNVFDMPLIVTSVPDAMIQVSTNIRSVPGAHGRAQILALCLGTREGTASAVPLSRSDSVRALAPAAKKFDSVPFFPQSLLALSQASPFSSFPSCHSEPALAVRNLLW